MNKHVSNQVIKNNKTLLDIIPVKINKNLPTYDNNGSPMGRHGANPAALKNLKHLQMQQ